MMTGSISIVPKQMQEVISSELTSYCFASENAGKAMGMAARITPETAALPLIPSSIL